jgi:type I restriction enzyme M protein
MPSSNSARFVNFLREMSDVLRDTIARRHYPDIVIPLVLLRRLDCTCAAAGNPVDGESGASASRPASDTLFKRLLDDPSHLVRILEQFIEGLDGQLQEILSLLEVTRTIGELEKDGLLQEVVRAFARLDLDPRRVSNQDLGMLFEEVLRSFVSMSDGHAGEFYSPPDVVELIARMVVALDPQVCEPGACGSVYDCACGTGGLLTGVYKSILQRNEQARLTLYGQELNPMTYALCRADLYLQVGADQAENIRLGNTLIADAFRNEVFRILVGNPPYGLNWKSSRGVVEREARQGALGRFAAGYPRVDDGQLLFLQHLLAHMRPPEDGGSVIAVVTNGSPLFNGGVGSGESNIRRAILERDLLTAIIALPGELFYNTEIPTYLWLLTNRKEPGRRGIVQVIDATHLFQPLRRNQGKKRRELSSEHISTLVDLVLAAEEGSDSKMCPADSFGYRDIVVERPLRLAFQVTPDRLGRLGEQKVFREQQEAAVRPLQPDLWQEQSRLQVVEQLLAGLPTSLYRDRALFVKDLRAAAGARGIRLADRELDALLAALGERDETAAPCRDGRGNLEPDPELRDHEHVSLHEEVADYMAREVLPYVPDAWVDETQRDELDGQVGRVGYEINVSRLFYRYQPLRSLEDITADILALEEESQRLLRSILGDR